MKNKKILFPFTAIAIFSLSLYSRIPIQPQIISTTSTPSPVSNVGKIHEGADLFESVNSEDKETEIVFSPPFDEALGQASWKEFWGSSTPDMSSTPELTFVAQQGTPVYSPVAGTISEIQNDVIWPSGRSIMIRCANNDVEIEVSHLESIEGSLEIGDSVDNSVCLGTLGSSGNASRPLVGIGVFKKNNAGTLERVYLNS